LSKPSPTFFTTTPPSTSLAAATFLSRFSNVPPNFSMMEVFLTISVLPTLFFKVSVTVFSFPAHL